ncbi:unnamed protein product [Durusdinium trenchii]|uniref:RING-type domain-containing protein n=1 Tax=Durusdinium trenchii TaxID=1381693 RepID=A0ABP0I2J2_9DINO
MLDDQPTHLLVGKICSSTVWPLWLKNIETQKSRFCPSSVFVTQMAEAGEADKELEVPKDGTMDLIACLDALPTSELTSLESITSKACTICLDAYAVGDQVKTLACGCVFHGGCMEQWGQANDGCQQCGKPWRPAVSAHHRTMASDQCTNRLSE